MLKYFEWLQWVTTAPIKPADDTISIKSSDALTLNGLMAIGDKLYLTLKHGAAYEVVLYEHNAVIAAGPGTVKLPVIRGAVGTGRKAFASQLCIKASLHQKVLNKLMCQAIEECIGDCDTENCTGDC